MGLSVGEDHYEDVTVRNALAGRALYDPAQIYLYAVRPLSGPAQLAATQLGPGQYRALFNLSEPGTWRLQWAAGGTYQGRGEWFTLEVEPLPPGA